MKLLILALLHTTLSLANSDLEDSIKFFEWLEGHAKDFAICEPTLEGENYVLCDKTKVSKAELKRLFSLNAEGLLQDLKGKGLKVELVCAEDKSPAMLGKECVQASKNKMFAEIAALHGKFLPEENIILIRNSASPGSLVHEYVHSLQSANTNPIYGTVYKKRRNELQKKLTALMDKKIAEIQKLEKEGKQQETKLHLQEFMTASEVIRGFAPWQDLIDERGIFLLYLKYGKDFGATDADLALARKNMGFICKNPKLTKLIPEKQCKL